MNDSSSRESSILPFNTDKQDHGYIPVYREIIKTIPQETARICEIGVYHGGSLEMWQSFFPMGIVVGVDNFPKCTWPEGTVKVIMDQANPALQEKLLDISPEGYNLIVDDGCHMSSFVEASFRNLWSTVVPGGWYVIEDWISAGNPMRIYAPTFVSRLHSDSGDDIAYIQYYYDLIIIRKKGI